MVDYRIMGYIEILIFAIYLLDYFKRVNDNKII